MIAFFTPFIVFLHEFEPIFKGELVCVNVIKKKI